MSKKYILPRHKRVPQPPPMRLTARDVQVIQAVHEYRVLRREQIQQLLFPSRNTANERLQRLYQHRFLERRWLPVEYGQGAGQAIYLLDQRGADLIAEQSHVEPTTMGWRQARNHVRSPFLGHRVQVNDVRISFTLAAQRAGFSIEKWVGQDELAAEPDYVHIPAPSGARRLPLIPDSYFVLGLGPQRAHFFLELDRATLPNRRWRMRVQAYLAYVAGGAYTTRYHTRSLRVLVVTTGRKRLVNLKRATESTGGEGLFWFTTLDQLRAETVLSAPIWQVCGDQGARGLIGVTRSDDLKPSRCDTIRS
jgi:hypothetical protein